MTNERKKDLGFKLYRIVEELKSIAKETDSCIDVYTQGYSHYDGISVSVHYGDGDSSRMVAIHTMHEVKEAFFIERDDTVRKENDEYGKDNAEE